VDRNRRDHAIAGNVDTNNATRFGNSTFNGLQSQSVRHHLPEAILQRADKVIE
jgi:hypothetical protein